jgi:hypothetical protein
MFVSFTIDACRVQLLRWFKKKKGGIGPPHKLLLFPLLLFFILLLTQPKTDQEQREEGGKKESEMTFGWLDEGLKKERKKKLFIYFTIWKMVCPRPHLRTRQKEQKQPQL